MNQIKKTRMGRKPLPLEVRRSCFVGIRLTEAERHQLTEDAARAGLTVSGLLVGCWKKATGRG